jgi:hypothetical protein
LRKKEKTVTRSFRISESAFKALEEDAARKNVSVNTLVNQLFLTHANYDIFYDKIGLMRVSQATFSRLVNACSDEVLIETARLTGKDIAKAIILAKHGVLSLTTVLDFIRTGSLYGGYAEYSEVENQGKRSITLMHNHGQKGAIFLRYYFESLFELVGCQPKVTSSEHSVTFEI